MYKLKVGKVIELKSVKNNKEYYDDGDFKLELYVIDLNSKIGILKFKGEDLQDLNGPIYLESDDDVFYLIKRLFNPDEPLDDLTSLDDLT
jgi:hypothetical protein